MFFSSYVIFQFVYEKQFPVSFARLFVRPTIDEQRRGNPRRAHRHWRPLFSYETTRFADRRGDDSTTRP